MHDADRDFIHLLRRQALYRNRNQAARALIGRFTRFRLDLPNDARHIVPSINLNRIQQLLPRFVHGHLRDHFQLLNHGSFGLAQLVFFPIEPALTLVQLLVALFQSLHPLVELAASALDTLIFIIKVPPASLKFGVRFRHPPPRARLGIGDNLQFLGLGVLQNLLDVFRCLYERALAFLLLLLQQQLHTATAAEDIAGAGSNKRDNEYCNSQ